MPDLTAADLYELVNGWPDEARPDARWSDGKWWVPIDGRDMLGYASVYVETAIALHEASGLRWLAGQNVELLGMGPIIHVHQHGDEWWVYCKDFDGKGPTLLHAIDAAIKGVG